ncbi:MAG: phosphotransferase family protein [Nocardioidaceae bacterium]
MTSSNWYGAPLRTLEGGYSGETYLAGSPPDQVVVRIYARDPARAAVDASLLRLVRGLVPVPEVLELRHPTDRTPAVLVTRYVAGTRLDLALADRSEPLDLERLGQSLADMLNTLGGIPFLRFAKFADADLTLSAEELPGDLRGWAEHVRDNGRLSAWAVPDWEALLALVDLAEDLQAGEAEHQSVRAVLVHSDVNPKNILVDGATAQIVALLDWEFAHAGSPYTDLGNLCRFERDAEVVEPLLSCLTGVRDGDVGRHLRLARAADLWALLELAGRPRPGPVQQLADELLLAQARAGDLDAWPWATSRVAPNPG